MDPGPMDGVGRPLTQNRKIRPEALQGVVDHVHEPLRELSLTGTVLSCLLGTQKLLRPIFVAVTKHGSNSGKLKAGCLSGGFNGTEWKPIQSSNRGLPDIPHGWCSIRRTRGAGAVSRNGPSRFS